MSDPEFHECCTCGYTWRHGHDGSHNCSTYMTKTIADLRAQLVEKEAELEKERIYCMDYVEQRNDANAKLAAANKRIEEAEKCEPVYEFREIGESGWISCKKEFYDKAAAIPELDTRIIYTRPIPPADVAELRESKTAKQQYDEFMQGEDEPSAIERLRFFCSLSMKGQDWLDVEPFFDAMLNEAREKAVPEWIKLCDVEWMNIVNHPDILRWDVTKEEAVDLAVKMTETKLKQLNCPVTSPANAKEGEE